MRWSERMKLTFETFKRVALPIYGWYFIFAFAGLAILMAGLLPYILPILNTKGSTFPGPFPNPNPPKPPGSSFDGISPFSDFLGSYISSPYLSHIPYLLLSIVLILLLSWIGSSAFITGMFNLTQKGLHQNVRFRDFRFSGMFRVLGWYGILTLVSFLIILAGIIGAFALRGMTFALAIIGGIYILLLVSLGIFLIPWLSTSVFYMLNHRELTFGRSLSRSWDFFRRNMGSLWILFITLIGIQILLSIISQSSPSLGFIISLIVAPFTAILPIVWVLSLEEGIQAQSPTTWASSPSSLETPPENPPEAPIQTEEPSSPVPPDVSSNDFPSPSSPSPAAPISTSVTAPSATPTSSENQDSPQSPASSNLPGPVNYCPTCGQKTRPDAKYCSQCGTQL